MDFSSNCSEISDYSEYRLELDSLVQGTDDQWLFNAGDTSFDTCLLSSSNVSNSFNIAETSPGEWNFLEDKDDFDDTESLGSLYDFDSFTDEKLFGADTTGFDITLIELELREELETAELLEPISLESDNFTLPEEVQLYLATCSSAIEQGEKSGLSPAEINFTHFPDPALTPCMVSSTHNVLKTSKPEKPATTRIPSCSTSSRSSTFQPATVAKSHQKSKSLSTKPFPHNFVSKIPQFKASTPSLCSSITSSTASSRRSTIFSPPISSPLFDSSIPFDYACKYPSLSRNSLQALSKGSQKFPSRIPQSPRTLDFSRLDAAKVIKRCSTINPLSWQTSTQPLAEVHRPLVNRSSLPVSYRNLDWKTQLSRYRSAI